MNKMYKALAVLLVVFGLFAASGENSQVSAAKKKDSFFKKTASKIKKNIKKACKKTKHAVVNAGSAVTNKVMDSGVKAKAKITGKKAKKVWVKGHYSKGSKSHTKGHFRTVSKKGGKTSSSGSSSATGNGTAVSGQPLPPSQDPVLPNFSKSRK